MSISEPEFIDFAGASTVVVRGQKIPFEDMPKFMDTAFDVLGELVREGQFQPAGPAFCRYDEPPSGRFTGEVGFPVDEGFGRIIKARGQVVLGSQLPAGRIATTKYAGGYGGLADAWTEFIEKVEDRGYDTGAPIWEAYDVAPLPGVLEEDLLTGLATPVRRRD
jgi:effector-binding domain-containing protein